MFWFQSGESSRVRRTLEFISLVDAESLGISFFEEEDELILAIRLLFLGRSSDA